MLTLPKEIASHDEVDPSLRPLYVPKEGGTGFVFKDITGMQNAFVATKTQLQTTTAQLTAAQQQLEGWKDYKLDEVKALVASKAEIEAAKAGLPAELNTIKTQLAQTYEGTIQAAKKEANTYKGQIESGVRESAVRDALIASGARTDRIDQLAKLVAPTISVIWGADGKPRAAIMGDNNMPKLNPETANEMSVADIVAGFKKDLPEWFAAQAGSGGGASGQTVVAPTEGDPRKWTVDQQRAYAKVHGETALQQLILNSAKPKAA
jgi:hypothetical protein